MALQVPVAQALTGLLNSGNSITSGNSIRTAWLFSSTLRRQQLSASTAATALASAVGGTAAAAQSILAGTVLPVGVLPVVEMAINPNSVTWDQPKRWTKKDVRNGSVFFHFTNDKGQNNDVLTLNFQGNTGNIDLRASLQSQEGEDAVGAKRKLQVWHNLYLLTREPVLLNDRRINVKTITISSQLLPQPITFSGFYNKVLDFSETADKPHSRDYAFSFTVTSVEPDLDTMVTDVLQVLTTTPSSATDASTLFGDNVSPQGG